MSNKPFPLLPADRADFPGVVGVVRAATTTVCEILAPGRGDELYSGYLEGEQYESALLKHARAIVSTAKSNSTEYRTAAALLASSTTNTNLKLLYGINKRQAKAGRDDLASIKGTGLVVVRPYKAPRGRQTPPFAVSECVKFVMDPRNTRQVRNNHARYVIAAELRTNVGTYFVRS